MGECLIPGSVTIYGMSTPLIPSLCRYVGKTRKTLTERLNQHIAERNKRKSPKNDWIKSLIAKGLRPLIWPLELCPEGDWESCEREWISFFKPRVPLLNVSPGGDCGPVRSGWKHTEEAKKLISQSSKRPKRPSTKKRIGHKWTTEQREKCSRRLVGWKPSEKMLEAARQANTGKKRDPELVKRIAAAMQKAKQRPVICVETGTVYTSYREAAESVGVKPKRIHRAISWPHKLHGKTFRFVEKSK